MSSESKVVRIANFGIDIYEKRIVRQFGHLQELYRDARSTKHKINYGLKLHVSGAVTPFRYL